ncbi:MAG: hypothetical protein NTW08_03045 [Gammaproteobacteria bacterium]|nr:hypothetical protein [Gammaproteobacteria bacterium]
MAFHYGDRNSNITFSMASTQEIMLKRRILSIICFFLPFSVFATDPWFTGPMLANASLTQDKNHLSTEIYDFYLDNEGKYIKHPLIAPTSSELSNSGVIEAILGLTDTIDVELTANYSHNMDHGFSSDAFGDTNLLMGLQLLAQDHRPNRMDIRLTVQETIPTGRFKDLNPIANGTDSSGLGSYQTNMGLNLGYTFEPFIGHYLKTTVNLNYLYAQTATISGLNAYLPLPVTTGSVNPGNLKSVDIALELSLTQHWVVGVETYLSHREAETFSGIIDIYRDPKRKVGSGLPTTTYTLLPTLEYNYSENLGIIAGYWYSVGGKNGSKFTSPTIAVVYIV